jgi:ribose 5-phosphate isomerase B
MRIHIAADHAAFDFKAVLADHLRAAGHDVVDHGAYEYDPLDDYPAFCFDAAEAVVADEGSLGVVMGGSGNGEQIAANKVQGVRAALAWSVETAVLARNHNNANVVSLGARMHTNAEALDIVDAFIAAHFSFDQRHQRRIDQVAAFEA